MSGAIPDSDDGFADVERIELPVRYARHDILIEELARVEHHSEVSTLKVLLEGVRPHGGAAARNESKARMTRLALVLVGWGRSKGRGGLEHDVVF